MSFLEGRLSMDKTIIYYTCNREVPIFEERIKKSLWEAKGGLPLISVSHKPIDFGTNICVGKLEHLCGHNIFRQIQIGAKAATTQYVCTAEADMLYPKEYFDFIPPKDDRAYVYMPLYVLFDQRGYGRYYALKPRGSESAMIINRELLIESIEKMLDGWGYWGPEECNGETIPYFFNIAKRDKCIGKDPVITFKTDRNIHKKTPHKDDDRYKDLAPWGNVYDMIRRYRGAD